MREAWNYFKDCKKYWFILSCVILGAYGFALTHYSIGIDDTCVSLYYKEGIEPAMGRWCLYLIAKIVDISAFTPWFIEFVSMIIMAVSVTLWGMLFYRIFGNRISWGVYCVFSCVFVSCPLISEIYVYHLHNGICTAYGVIALSLHMLLSALTIDVPVKRRVSLFVLSVIGVLIGIGFYESFLLVFLIGAVFLLFFVLDHKEQSYCLNPLVWGISAGGIGIFAVFLRSIVLRLLKIIYRYEIPENYTVGYRSIFENLGQETGELMMALKKYVIMYWANAYAYLPIAVLVLSLLFLGVYALLWKRNVWMVLCCVAIMIVPTVLVVVEGYPTHYRASQYVPLVGACAALIVGKLLYSSKVSLCIRWVGAVASAVLIFNQCADMNKWFYVDWLKYKDAETVMRNIAYELESKHDISKPIVFRGAYEVPYEICKDAYVEYNSDKYYRIIRIADLLGEHVKDKFNERRAFRIAETPINSTLQWGVTAFDGTATQLGRFWEMHGYDEFIIEKNLQVINEAEQYKVTSGMPGYPIEGYIAELDDYIIVNLDSTSFEQ